jgi:hypothetical protein
MKQTAVDWLHHKIMNPTNHELLDTINLWFAKAKEMEKEQIENAFDTGLCEGYDYGFTNDSPTKENGEQYYKENYEKK